MNNVVFPYGAVVIGEDLFVYYGGADSVIGVATMKLSDLVNSLITWGQMGSEMEKITFMMVIVKSLSCHGVYWVSNKTRF